MLKSSQFGKESSALCVEVEDVPSLPVSSSPSRSVSDFRLTFYLLSTSLHIISVWSITFVSNIDDLMVVGRK